VTTADDKSWVLQPSLSKRIKQVQYMQKFTVFATIAILTHPSIALAGTVVSNNVNSTNTATQINQNLGSSGTQQGGSQIGTNIQNQVVITNTSNSANITNIGTNLNNFTQNNTFVQLSMSNIATPVVQGGFQTGIAILNQSGNAISTGSNVSANTFSVGTSGNYLNLNNLAIGSVNYNIPLDQGGAKNGLAIVNQATSATVIPPSK
jgi:hypothetical protein